MSKHEHGWWRSLVAKFERAGMSQAAFAAASGVSLPAFRHRLYKFRAADQGASAALVPEGRNEQTGLRLLPVEVRQAANGSPDGQVGAIEVDVATLRMRIVGGADPAYVAALVGALREPRC
jgi:hypothetical protein